jgi:hypothetical protein
MKAESARPVIEASLRERLERLRLRGAAERLTFALAREELRVPTQGLRKGLGMAAWIASILVRGSGSRLRSRGLASLLVAGVGLVVAIVRKRARAREDAERS